MSEHEEFEHEESEHEESDDPVQQELDLNAYRHAAQKIGNRLAELDDASEKDKRRWIWELLQNAKDTFQDQKVDIEINFSNDVLEFKHNGGCFSPKNVSSLMEQVSSKREEVESSGKFGTGFLTTHIISRLVDVEGIIYWKEKEIFYKFCLTLDRRGSTDNENELIEGLRKTRNSREQKQIESIQDPWTRFYYRQPNLSITSLGIQAFKSSIFYVLAFVKKLGSIKIDDKVNSLNSEYALIHTEFCTEDIKILHFLYSHNNQQDEFHLLYANDHEGVELAIEIEAVDSKYRIAPIKNTTPRLFCAFPLIGTEMFSFPMVVNSVNFHPKTERDGLNLQGNSIKSRNNQKLIEKGVELYQKVLNYVSEQEWFDLYQLAANSCPPANDDFDEDWYKRNILFNIRKFLLTIPIVESETGNRLYISRDSEREGDPFACFPWHKDQAIQEKIWDFTYDLFPDFLPKKQHIHDWYSILWDKKGFRQTLEATAQDIQNLGNLNGLAERQGKGEDEVIGWLNQLLGFFNEQEPELFKKYSVLPNQRGVFKKKEELYTDQNIPDELKDVLEIIGQDWRGLLLHRSITQVDMTNRYKNVKMLSKAIDEYVDGFDYLAHDDGEHLTEDKEKYEQTMFKLVSALLEYSALDQISNEHEQILKFAQDYFDQMPSSIEILEVDQNIDLHSEVFKWFLNDMAVNISSHENLDNLGQKLNIQVETVEWLNDFILFIQTHDVYKKNIDLDEILLLPNQYGVFKRKEELCTDQDIPNELKDVLKIIDQDWRCLLLDRLMTAVEIKVNKNVELLSVAVNQYIDSADDEDKIFELVSSLIGYSLTAEPSHEHQQIWEFARTYYFDKIPSEIKYLETFQDTDLHEEAFKWLLKDIAKQISSHEDLDNLGKFIHSHIEAIEWLNDFISFIQDSEKYKKIVDFDEIPLLPNQDGIFHSKEFLFKDDNIDPDLKEILKLLNRDWIGELLDLRLGVSLPDNKTRGFQAIAEKIDKTFHQEFRDKATQESIFIQSFQKLLGEDGWIKKQDDPDKVLTENFPWINANKSELSLSMLGEGKEKDKVFELLQGGNIEALSKIQNNFSQEELDELTSNPDGFRNYLKQKKMGGNLISVRPVSNLNPTSGSSHGGNPNVIEDITRSNREAKEAVKQYLKSRSDYDLTGWRAESQSKTIILGVRKHGVEIKLVIKGADHQLRFDDAGKEHSVLRETFSELWIYSNGSIIQITLGGAIRHNLDSSSEPVNITNYEIYTLPQEY